MADETAVRWASNEEGWAKVGGVWTCRSNGSYKSFELVEFEGADRHSTPEAGSSATELLLR